MTIELNVAATIAAISGLLTVVGQVVVQILQFKQLRKSNDNGRKLDENTELTRNASKKLDAVHDEVVAVTGQHPALKLPDP